MAELLGKIQGKCATTDMVHTRSNCDVDQGLIASLLVTTLDFTFPTTTPDEFNEAIQAGILAGKVVVINGIEGADATGGDVAQATTPYGTNIPVGINAVSVPYYLNSGGSCLEKELSKLNRMQRRIVEIDKAGMAWGTEISEGVGRGFIGSIMTTHTRATNNTTPYIKYFNVGYTSDYENEWNNRFAIESATFDGLMGIMLVPGTVGGTARIVDSCSGMDVGAEIAAAATTPVTTAFIDESGANPATATIDPDTGVVTIAPAGSYRIAPATVLDGLNIIGYDGLNKFAAITPAP